MTEEDIRLFNEAINKTVVEAQSRGENLTREEFLQKFNIEKFSELDYKNFAEVDNKITAEMNEKNPDKQVLGTHMSWGPEAKGLTKEQLLEYAHEVEKEIARYNALPVEKKMLEDFENVYTNVRHAIQMVSFDRMAGFRPDSEKPSYEELESRLMAAHGGLEFALLSIGNWLKQDVTIKLDQEVIKMAKINHNDKFLTKRFIDKTGELK